MSLTAFHLNLELRTIEEEDDDDEKSDRMKRTVLSVRRARQTDNGKQIDSRFY